MNNGKNVMVDKSYAFSLRIIKFFNYLKDNNEYILSKQVLRSGTSIGANIEESQGAQSRKDFISKLSISYKEARETHYWLRLLKDSGIAEDKITQSMIGDCEELIKMLTSILNSSKQ